MEVGQYLRLAPGESSIPSKVGGGVRARVGEVGDGAKVVSEPRAWEI